jgi:integrase/recombinase XerD
MAKRKEGEILPTAILWEHSTNSEGLHPVKIRITYHRKPKYYSVYTQEKQKLFLSKEDYLNAIKTQEMIRKEELKDKATIRKRKSIIDHAIQAANEAVKKATQSGRDPFSFAQFEKEYLGEEAGTNFLKFFKSFLDSIALKQAGTHRCYLTVYYAFGEFVNGRDIHPPFDPASIRDIDPISITTEKLEEYETWLRSTRKLSDTSISIHMRCLRMIYNRMAQKDEYLKLRYPFSQNDYDGKFKVPISSGQKGETLTKDEIFDFIRGKKFNGDAIPENPMYRAKMLFLFSFFGQGVNFKDVAMLKYGHIKGNAIEFERQKTIRTRRKAITVHIPITRELQDILSEIGNPDKRKASYIFEVFDPAINYTGKEIDAKVLQFVKTTNKWLKRYCELNKITVVTTYSARHTFASLAKIHLPLAQISEMLGHSKIETTQIYLGRFADEENRSGLMKVFKSIKKKSA